MSPIKLLRSLFYGFLLFTARSIAEPPRRVDEVRMVGPALPEVPALIQSVIEYQSQNTINHLVGAIQETQKNYYLDEQTFIELEKMYEYILYPYAELSYAIKTRIETTYLLHIKSYLTLKNEYKALPPLKKSIIKRYETAINYRGKFPPLEKDPIEENFKDARQTIVPQSSESFLSFMASTKKNQINTTAFHQLISDAQHSPLAKNCEDLLTALEIINNSPKINGLPALTIFDMRHAKALIKQETDFLDIHDVIKFTRSITQEEFNLILMIYPFEADELITMLALSTIEDIGLEIVNYIANERINNFIAEHLAQEEPLEKIFQVVDTAVSSPLVTAENLSDLYTSTAAAFMELSEHNLAFMDKKFSRPITSLINKHIEQASTDPLRISIYKQQKDLMMQKLSPEYLDSSKDALFLVELNKKLPSKDNYEKLKILIPLFHQFYNFNYYPNDNMLRKLNDLALAGIESLNEILNETFMLHFITYSKLSNRDDLELTLPKLKKTVEQYLDDEMANFSKDRAYLAFLYNDLLEKFYSAVKRRPIKDAVYPESPNTINALGIKKQIIDLKKSFFKDDYLPLAHMIKYNHIPSTPELTLWTQCADFIIRNETNYLDDFIKPYQLFTQRTLTTALENSQTTTQEFFQLFRENPPDFIRKSYVHNLGQNLAKDFISKVNANTPELFFNILNRMNIEGKPIDIKQMYAAAALAMIELNKTQTFTTQNFTAQVFHWILQSKIPENTFRYEIYEKAKQVIVENYRPLLSFYPRMVVYFILPGLIVFFSIKYLHSNVTRPQVSPPPVSDVPDTKKLIIDHYKNTAQPIDEFPKKWAAFAITLKSVLLIIDQNPDLIVEKHKVYARTLYASWQLQSDGEKFIIFINRNIDWLITHKKYDLFKLLGQLSLDYQNLNWEDLLVAVDNKYLEKNRINQINLLKSKLLEVIKNKKYIRLVNDFYDPDNKGSWINGTEHANARHFINQNKAHLDADTVRALDTMFPVIIRDFTFAYTDSYENDDEDKIFPNFLFDTTIQQSNEQMKIPQLETQSAQNNASSGTQMAFNKITVTLNEKYVGEALGLEPYIYERFNDIENQYIHSINLAYKFLIIRFFSITPLAKLKPDARKIFNNIRDGLCHDWNKMTQINPIDLNAYLSDILNSISETKNNITSLEELFKKLNLYDGNFLNLNRRWENIHIREETAKQKLNRLFEELSTIEKMPVNMKNLAVRASDDILAQIGETLRYAHIDMPADVKHYFITLRNDAYHKYDFKLDTQVVLYLEKLKTHLASDTNNSLQLANK